MNEEKKEPQTIEMKLAAEPFEMIKSGQKTLEIRLYDEKRKKIKIGDILILSKSDDGSEQIKAQVVALHKFQTFQELFGTQLFSKTGWSGMTAQEAAQIMYQFYTKKQEKTFGVLGIEIKTLR